MWPKAGPPRSVTCAQSGPVPVYSCALNDHGGKARHAVSHRALGSSWVAPEVVSTAVSSGLSAGTGGRILVRGDDLRQVDLQPHRPGYPWRSAARRRGSGSPAAEHVMTVRLDDPARRAIGVATDQCRPSGGSAGPPAPELGEHRTGVSRRRFSGG